MIIGFTGNIGSGKHSAAQLLKNKGFVVVDADKMAHDLYENGSDVWALLFDEFGQTILDENSEINRKSLANIVFKDDKKLKKLNQIVHPALINSLKTRIKELKKANVKYILIIAALADELDLKQLVDKVILISADLDKRIERVLKSRNLKVSEIKQRNSMQKTPQFFDIEIQNNEDLNQFLDLLEKTVLSLNLKNKASGVPNTLYNKI